MERVEVIETSHSSWKPDDKPYAYSHDNINGTL